MRHIRFSITIFAIVATAALYALPVNAQEEITTPLEFFGFNIGDDYQLANYTQFVAYWRTLADESPRMVLQDIGPTAEGRSQLMAIVTSPENHQRLERFRDISRQLALAEDLTDELARELAEEGRAVVWIDGGLHASEVVGSHQLIELSYQLLSQNDPETLRFLDDIIILLVNANPDGMELVSNWYMRNPEPTERSTRGLPVLYQKYTGHDNNRDSYMVTQPETENMARILYHEWIPQMMYNHHQVGPSGTIMWAPPFVAPFNYNFDPLLVMSHDLVGSAMHYRFIAEGKGGTTLRNGGPFSMWWNGALLTTPYFHNMLGILTETVGNPTPIQIPFVPDRHLPSIDMPLPIAPQEWHFIQSIDYSMTANRAVLDFASRYRETVLYNIYQMGRNSIERGSRDSWTPHPKRVEEMMAAIDADTSIPRAPDLPGALAGYFSAGVPIDYYEQLYKPEDRDPRGYILPSNQADFPTATKFVNTLLKNGVTVLRATSDFEVEDVEYPAGSYVIKTAQAFRPHILDMFEPQVHPDNFAYEGGPPTPPYDNAGWTLAFQMGVEFDRILEGFDGPFEAISGLADPAAGQVSNGSNATGFLLDHAINDAAVVTNRLLAAGHDVYWLGEETRTNGVDYPVGSVYIPAQASTAAILDSMAAELGVSFDGLNSIPGGDAYKLEPVRIGLWDEYGGSMPSGWTRWIFEQFEFPYELVYPKNLDEDDLKDQFDVLVFVTGGIPRRDGQENPFSRYFGGQLDPDEVPDEYQHMLGDVTVATTVPRLVEFLEDGGTIITIGNSTVLAHHLELPIENHLTDDRGAPLSPDTYYVPASILEARVDNTIPLAFGLDDRIDVFFSNSPVFRLRPDAQSGGVTPVAWFDKDNPLRSGWSMGEHRLNGGVAIAQAQVGEGTLYLFGPEVLHRAQPHGTFKFFFNGIYLAGAEKVRLDLTN
ncbi:MAG: M14 family metallopeptidase [Myxococcota bacterium]|nr:M14 family metallopeptidase [Myxococcota bacterium]